MRVISSVSLPFAPAAGAGAVDGERARAGGVRAAASASRRRHAPAAGSAGAHSLRGPSSRRLAALLSAVEGHRPSLALPEALDLGRRGRDRGARPGGRGKGLTTAKGRFEFLASARGRAQTAELSDAPSSRDRPRGSRIDDRRGGRYLAAPEFHHGVTSPCVSRLDYPARFGLDRSGLGEPRLLTSQAVQIAPSTSNITLPPR